MANHPSALKRHRQSLKRQERNRTRLSAIKTLSKKVVGEADLSKRTQWVQQATQLIDKAKRKGTLHARTAARKISQLARLANKAA